MESVASCSFRCTSLAIAVCSITGWRTRLESDVLMHQNWPVSFRPSAQVHTRQTSAGDVERRPAGPAPTSRALTALNSWASSRARRIWHLSSASAQKCGTGSRPPPAGIRTKGKIARGSQEACYPDSANFVTGPKPYWRPQREEQVNGDRLLGEHDLGARPGHALNQLNSRFRPSSCICGG